jgi:hypothetical protein
VCSLDSAGPRPSVAPATLPMQRDLERLTVTDADADSRDEGRMLGAVIAGIATIVAAAIVAWATLRPRRQLGGVISLEDVSVSEAETVLAEPGVDAHVLGATVPGRPVLDVAVRNDGDRTGFVRRMHLELQGLLYVPAIDPPIVLPCPGVAITGPLPARERRLGPSGSYEVNFPLQEGCYAHTVNQAVAAGDVDRFVVSLVAREAEWGKDFYQVTLSLDCGRTRKGRRRVTSEPIWVLAYGPPSWERPDVIKERLSQIADRVRELAPGGGEEVGVLFNSVVYPIRTGMEDYVAFYETKLQILAAALRKCLTHAADETRIRGWLAELERNAADVEDLLRHAADLRASGRHP